MHHSCLGLGSKDMLVLTVWKLILHAAHVIDGLVEDGKCRILGSVQHSWLEKLPGHQEHVDGRCRILRSVQHSWLEKLPRHHDQEHVDGSRMRKPGLPGS